MFNIRYKSIPIASPVGEIPLKSMPLDTQRPACRHSLHGGDHTEMFTEVQTGTRMRKVGWLGLWPASSPAPANCDLADITGLGLHIFQFKQQNTKTTLVKFSTYRRMRAVSTVWHDGGKTLCPSFLPQKNMRRHPEGRADYDAGTRELSLLKGGLPLISPRLTAIHFLGPLCTDPASQHLDDLHLYTQLLLGSLQGSTILSFHTTETEMPTAGTATHDQALPPSQLRCYTLHEHAFISFAKFHRSPGAYWTHNKTVN